MKIDLSLLSVSPYHSPPVSDGDYVVTDAGRVERKSPGGKVKGSPLTRTYKEPIYIEHVDEVFHFPKIRSMQIVRQFRDRINRHLFNSFQARGLSIASASTYAGITVGAASGQPAGIDATLEQITKAVKTPIAMFGGGTFSLTSTVAITDFNVAHEYLYESGVITLPAHLEHTALLNIEPFQLSYSIPITRKDPVANISNVDALSNIQLVENYKEQVLKWQADVEQAQSKRAEDKKEKKTDLNNLVAAEVILAGIHYVGSVSIPEYAGDSVKGALLVAAAEMIEEPVLIGGRISRGQGKFSAKASIGHELLDLRSYDREIAAYNEWLESVTPEDIAEYFER